MLTNAMPNRLREMGRIEQEKYLRRPRSVRIDDEFRLFVPDYERYRIQIYQKDFIALDPTQIASVPRKPLTKCRVISGNRIVPGFASVTAGA